MLFRSGGQYNLGYEEIFEIRNLLSFMDGEHDLLDIAKLCNLDFAKVHKVTEILKKAELVSEIN